MAVIGMSHNAFGGGKYDGYHTVFVSQDENETGYLLDTNTHFEGWVAKQQYGCKEWDWREGLQPEIIAAAKKHFINE